MCVCVCVCLCVCVYVCVCVCSLPYFPLVYLDGGCVVVVVVVGVTLTEQSHSEHDC